MMADGRHELAAETLQWARARLPRSERLAAAQRQVYLKLMEQYQSHNPFKFIVYAAQAAEVVLPIPEAAKTER